MGRVAAAVVVLAVVVLTAHPPSTQAQIPASRGHRFAAPLVPDEPYVEDVSMRLVTANMTAVSGWGQLPTTNVAQVANGAFKGADGVWMLSDTELWHATLPPSPYGTAATPKLPPTVATPSVYHKVADATPHSRFVTDSGGNLVAVVMPTAVVWYECAADGCSTSATTPTDCGTKVYDASTLGVASVVWVGCSNGLLRVEPSKAVWAIQPTEPVTAVATSPDGSEVAAGTSQKFYLVDAALPSSIPGLGNVVRWEWVTQVSTGSGGVIDDAITAMAYDACGSLWIGNNICVNVMFKDRSFVRISGLHGLPFHNVTSIVADGSTSHVWVGTNNGLSRYSPASKECLSPEQPSRVGDWVYYWGRRWLPGNNVTSVSSVGNTSFVATNGGIARIQHEAWTLERKAALFAMIVPRHDRHGFTADCSLPSPGNLTGIKCHPGESDGLWTGIMATSEVLRYAVKQDSASAKIAGVRMAAMNFLSTVTGIGGYMARTAALIPNAPVSPQWHNSTTTPGWAWQGDTSADEVVGHMFAFPLAQALLANASGQETMVHDRINTLVGYILQNHFFEIGFDGQKTKWGIWAPSYVNDLRSWSDQRGLNSLQVLCFLNVAYMVTGNTTYMDAINMLSNSTNQYQENQLNLKIEAPCDDNFSDSELAFLPFYSYLFFNDSATPMLDALVRSYNFARKERSSLYSSIYLAGTGLADMVAASDVLWNLQTWPLEWVDWTTHNSQRLDVYVNPQENRDMQHGTMSVRVLPANERSQFRWNHNPFTLDDGADGMVEYDPGAWLVAYWMARFHNVLGSAT